MCTMPCHGWHRGTVLPLPLCLHNCTNVHGDPDGRATVAQAVFTLGLHGLVVQSGRKIACMKHASATVFVHRAVACSLIF